MKKNTLWIVMLLGSLITSAQNIGLSFENATVTCIAGEFFYETDIMLTSDVAYTQGSGQFFIDYDQTAFGTLVATNNAIEYTRPAGSILGSQSFGFDNYNSFTINDSTPTKVSYIWQQFWSAGTIGVNVTAGAPILLVHLKMKMIDPSASPNVCLDATNPFDDQFFTACGPATPGAANCTTNPGMQILNYLPDCTGASLPSPITYVWNNGVWTPSDPSGISTPRDIIEVQSTGGALTTDTCIGNFTVEMAGTLDLGANNLTVVGNVVSDGSFNAIQGTLTITGGAAQQLSGDFQVGDLVINNSSANTITNLANIEVINRLDLIDGTLDTTGGSLTLNSDATSTAMVDQVATGSIVGNVIVERYIPGRRAFRLLASAVNTTSSIQANWQEGVSNATTASNNDPNPSFGTHITGSTTGANGFDATITGNGSMFILDNTAQAWQDVTSTTASTFTAGKAYRIMVRGSRAVDLTNNAATADATTLRATGTLAIGDVSQTDLSSTAGAFNFFGNPYQSSINLNTVMAASSNVTATEYYMWDPTLGARGAYVTVMLDPGTGAGTNTSMSAANEYLQPGQAAFVTTAAAGSASLLFQENSKAVGQNTNTFITDPLLSSSNILTRIYRTSAYAHGDPLQDSFGIFFSDEFSNDINNQDIPKFFNQDESIATATDDNFLSIERRSFPYEDDVIPLFITTYRTNAYTLSIQINNLDGVTPYLFDAFTGEYTALENGDNIYEFTLSDDSTSSASDRFSFAFAETQLSTEETSNIDFSLYPNPVSGDSLEITSSRLTGKQVILRVINILGQQLVVENRTFEAATLTIDGFNKLSDGVYFVKLDTEDGTITKKIIKK